MKSKPIQNQERDLAVIQKLLSRARRIKLLVHYVYFDPPAPKQELSHNRVLSCESQTKRLNLEMFIRRAVLDSPGSVEFHFSLGFALPDTDDYFQSLSLAGSDQRHEVIPNLPNVFVHQLGPNQTTDLIPHARWLEKHVKVQKGIEQYVVLMNEGVRGPFLEPSYLHHISSNLPLSAGVPPWFAPHLSKLLRNDNLGMVGSVLSQAVHSHLQSYFLSFKVDERNFADMISQQFSRTAKEGKWDTIVHGEVGISDRMLTTGFALGSMWPVMDNFTLKHAICTKYLTDDLGALPEEAFRVYAAGKCADSPCFAAGSRLSSFRSPYAAQDSNHFGAKEPYQYFTGPVEKVVFVKYGGEPWRQGWFPKQLVAQVEEKTKEALGLPKDWRPCE